MEHNFVLPKCDSCGAERVAPSSTTITSWARSDGLEMAGGGSVFSEQADGHHLADHDIRTQSALFLSFSLFLPSTPFYPSAA